MNLKVFEIRVRSKSRRGIEDLVVILSTDLITACEQTGYDSDIYELEGKELMGPFKSGTILSDWT